MRPQGPFSGRGLPITDMVRGSNQAIQLVLKVRGWFLVELELPVFTLGVFLSRILPLIVEGVRKSGAELRPGPDLFLTTNLLLSNVFYIIPVAIVIFVILESFGVIALTDRTRSAIRIGTGTVVLLDICGLSRLACAFIH